MTERARTPEEVRQEGLDVLLERLGPADTIRFLQQFGSGRGDYTAERGKWLGKLSVEEVLRSIEERERGAGGGAAGTPAA